MTIFCQQTILLKYHALHFQKLGKMSQNLLSAAVVIGTLRVNSQFLYTGVFLNLVGYNNLGMVNFTYQGVKG